MQSRRLLSAVARDPYNCLITPISPGPSKPGRLSGLRFVAKDNICTKDIPTTCASEILASYKPPFSATVVKLLQNQGLILVGKANLDQFGMGLSTLHSHFGPTLNPRAPNRICGGSSGGSAAAVAAGLAEFALGTDTGGSVRQPASYCGIVGFKPSYGRLSRYGVVAYGQGFDCVGILASTVDTVAKVYGTLDEHDPRDITSMSSAMRTRIASIPRPLVATRTLKIGIPEQFLLSEVQEETMTQVETVLRRLMDLGHTVVPISVPSMGRLLSAYYTLATVEAASNMSRFDGIRYGTSIETTPELLIPSDNLIRRNRSAGLGPEVQRRLILGNYTLSSESGDNFYRATKLRLRLVREFNDIFAMENCLTQLPGTENGCDVLIGPTASGRAPLVDEYHEDVEQNFLNEYVNDVYTVPASMAGLPAISVPCSDQDYGVQVIGQYGDDATVLSLAKLIEEIR